MSSSHPKIKELLRSLYLLEFDKARGQVDALLDLDPAYGRLADAIFAFYLGEFEEALELFDEAEELQTSEPLGDPALFLYRSFCFKELDRPGDAVAALRKGLEFSPEDTTLRATLGQAYTELGEPRKALETLHEEAGQRGAFESHRSRGEAQEALGCYDQAFEEYQLALRDFPFDEGLMNRISDLAIRCERIEEGVKFFARLQKKRQIDRLPSLYNLGILLHAQGKTHRVADVTKKIETFIPNDAFGLGYLVRLLQRQGKTRKIKTIAKRYLLDEVQGEIRAEVLFAVAEVYRDEGSPGKAISSAREGLAASPFHAGLRELLASLEPA